MSKHSHSPPSATSGHAGLPKTASGGSISSDDNYQPYSNTINETDSFDDTGFCTFSVTQTVSGRGPGEKVLDLFIHMPSGIIVTDYKLAIVDEGNTVELLYKCPKVHVTCFNT